MTQGLIYPIASSLDRRCGSFVSRHSSLLGHRWRIRDLMQPLQAEVVNRLQVGVKSALLGDMEKFGDVFEIEIFEFHVSAFLGFLIYDCCHRSSAHDSHDRHSSTRLRSSTRLYHHLVWRQWHYRFVPPRPGPLRGPSVR